MRPLGAHFQNGQAAARWGWSLLIGLGILNRVVVYWQNRSLFLDEANLARNIAELSPAGLLAPLNYQQYAPPLWLGLEKMSWWITGPSEWSLRWWPLFMGSAALVGLALLLRRVAGRGLPALFVLYLFAFSQVYVRYSSELKQYSTDMAVTTALVWAALRYPPGRRAANWYWALLGSLAIWLSMPSIFILAGIGLFFLYRFFQGRTEAKIGALLLIGGCWLLQFILYFWFILGHDLQKPELISYHQPYFWPLWPDTGEAWRRMADIGSGLLSTLIGHTVPAILLGIAGLSAGALRLWKRGQRDLLLLLFAPILLCLLASGLGYYSLMERLTLFMMPLPGLLLAIGLREFQHITSRWGQLIVLALAISVLPLRKGMQYLFQPLQYEEMRPLLTSLHARLEEGSLLWVDHNAQPAFLWYTRYAPVPGPESWRQQSVLYNRWDARAAAEVTAGPDAPNSVWLLFSHLVSAANRADMEADLRIMQAQYGPPQQRLQFPGAAAFQFRLQDFSK